VVSMASIHDREAMNYAMIDGFKGQFKAALRAQLLKEAEPLIEAAIADAMKTFDVAIQQHWTPHRFSDVVEVILRDSRNEFNSRQFG
jgi:hypothetical protein